MAKIEKNEEDEMTINHDKFNLNCPSCHRSLTPVSTDALSDWAGEVLLVCMNDNCDYFTRSWQTMYKQGVPLGYRYQCRIDGSGEGTLLVADDRGYKDRVLDWDKVYEHPDSEIVTEVDKKTAEEDFIDRLGRIERKLDQLIMFFTDNPNLFK